MRSSSPAIVAGHGSGEKQNFMCKAMCLFMDMDKMLGAEFEKGLASLKSIVEAEPPSGDNQDNS